MTPDPRPVDRRTFLQATAVAGATVAVAGCAGSDDDGTDNVVLPPPEDYDEVVAEEMAIPTYGEQVPELAAPDPIRDVDVTTTQFVGDSHSMYTFVFTRCEEACSGLMANLRHAQEDSINEGYDDELVLLNVTFDPEYDTAEVLDQYERDYSIDQDVGNFYSLRPETPAEAEEFVTDGFGVAFEEDESHGHGDDDDHGNGHDNGHDDNDDHDNGHDDNGHDGDRVHYAHTNLILFVNRDGYVERAYHPDVPTPADVIEDVQTVVEGW